MAHAGVAEHGIIFFLAVLMLLLVPVNCIPTVRADGGFIVPTPQEQHVLETSQNALAAWDGSTERLFLTTAFSVNNPVSTIRIVPFPVPVNVSASERDLLDRTMNIVNTDIEGYDIGNFPGRSGGYLTETDSKGGSAVEVPELTVLFTRVIGSSDVDVVHAATYEGFRDHIASIFVSLDNGTVFNDSGNFKTIINDYLSRDIRYFAISRMNTSVVGLEGETPFLCYEFQTDRLYYPMLISYIGGEVRDVMLITLTHRFLLEDEFRAFCMDDRYSTELNSDDLEVMGSGLEKMFPSGARCTVWRHDAPLVWTTINYTYNGQEYPEERLVLGSDSEFDQAVRTHGDIDTSAFRSSLWDSAFISAILFVPVLISTILAVIVMSRIGTRPPKKGRGG